VDHKIDFTPKDPKVTRTGGQTVSYCGSHYNKLLIKAMLVFGRIASICRKCT